MIKINLGKGVSKASVGAHSQDDDSRGGGDDGIADLRKVAIQRIAIMLLGPILLFAYENVNIPELRAESNRLSTQMNEMSNKNAEDEQSVAQLEKMRETETELTTKIASLEELQKDRLREIQLFDVVQKEVPEKVWLNSFAMSAGALRIQGFAQNDGDITQFMENLSRTSSLKNVTLIRSSDHTGKSFGRIKKFEIGTSVGGEVSQ